MFLKTFSNVLECLKIVDRASEAVSGLADLNCFHDVQNHGQNGLGPVSHFIILSFFLVKTLVHFDLEWCLGSLQIHLEQKILAKF